ncbi:MAG: pseudouridine synthase [Bacilli bacterium]|jgi:23S rRNA pseudouridine2605 synthase
MEKERIQKILSQLGYCSRRKAEALLADGRISVNGETITEAGFKCLETDDIKVDGKSIGGTSNVNPVYLMLNKPFDYVSTANDPEGRPTVVELIPESYGRVFPVGRLDHNSTGLLIMTNDGEFANLVTHPSSAPEKEYLVKGRYPLNGDEVDKLQKGLYITREGYTALPAKAKILQDRDDDCLLSITIREGKKREVRHMMETLGHPVISLTRIRIGSLLLGRLPEGKYQEIPADVIEDMKTQCLYDKAHNTFVKTNPYEE